MRFQSSRSPPGHVVYQDHVPSANKTRERDCYTSYIGDEGLNVPSFVVVIVSIRRRAVVKVGDEDVAISEEIIFEDQLISIIWLMIETRHETRGLTIAHHDCRNASLYVY